jgi:DNA-binding MarR family transcriptional regulator
MEDTSIPISAVLKIRDECLCFASQRAARLLARRFDKLFAPLGITNQQYSMLVALSGRWQPRLGELADFLGVDSTTMTAAAKALEKRGILSLVPDETDARSRRPVLTSDGKHLVATAEPLWREDHARLQDEVEGIDARDLAKILAALGR